MRDRPACANRQAMNAKITDYCIVSADLAKTLQATVAEMLKEGWQPWGNLVVNSPVLPEGEVDLEFFQALVRYADAATG